MVCVLSPMLFDVRVFQLLRKSGSKLVDFKKISNRFDILPSCSNLHGFTSGHVQVSEVCS